MVGGGSTSRAVVAPSGRPPVGNGVYPRTIRVGGRRSRAIRRWCRVAAAVGFCVASGLLGFAAAGLTGGQRMAPAQQAELVRWQGAYADLTQRLRREVDAGERRTAALREELARARLAEREANARFTTVAGELRRWAAGVEAELEAVAEERDGAIALARELGRSLDEAQAWLRAATDEKVRLAAELAFAEARVTAVAEERDAARREGQGLARHAGFLEAELRRARDEPRVTLAELRAWIGEQVEALEGLFASTGLDPEALIARALDPDIAGDGEGGGQGGPLELAPAAGVQIYAGLTTGGGGEDGGPQIGDAFGRMLMLQRLLTGLPLGAPLDQYEVTSRFGERVDPIARRAAFHGGIDLVAAQGARVQATAPGVVVHAGRAGAYGNMVEIDHGFGVVTRYGQLKEVTIAIGDRVSFGQEIGVIGSTGRSTGRHLHYEIRTDGEPRDPAKFISTGRRLIGVFQG